MNELQGWFDIYYEAEKEIDEMKNKQKHNCDMFCREYGCMKEKFCDQEPPCGNPIGKHKHVTAKAIGENEMSTFGAGVNKEQPLPKDNNSKPIWDMIIEEMKERDQVGRSRYGKPLQSMNGRNSPIDALQEHYDLIAYTRQWVEERKEIVDTLKDIFYSDDFPRVSGKTYSKLENLLLKLGELK